MGLEEPLRRLVGGPTAKALSAGLDLATVGDLLRHYPRRYAERGELTDLDELRVGEHVTVLAEVEEVVGRRFRDRKGSLLEVTVTDRRGRLRLTFFNQPWRAKELTAGRRGLFSGKVGTWDGRRQLAHPDYILLDERRHLLAADSLLAFANELIPVYPASAALPSWRVARCVQIALDSLAGIEDPLPGELRDRHGLLDLRAALEGMHRPTSREQLRRARERMRWEEAFILQVALARRRAASRALGSTPRRAAPDGLLAAFDARLPFALTAGQREVGATIERELAESSPMHRLLQGEVGSGKTVVAVRAMLTVVDSGGQAALLAPTEVLAQQHHRTITSMLGPLADGGLLGGDAAATSVALITGSQSAAARRAALRQVASGDAGIVVGTHALLQEGVAFRDLGLVVVDEQHRFGVEQRDVLRAKAAVPPHVLVMTATPIPRTVAMTVFGDLELSTLRELPLGRAPISTHVVPAGDKPHFLDRAWARLREEVEAGHQAYVVCPRIGDGGADDDLDAAASDGNDGSDATGSEGTEPSPPRPPLSVAAVAPLLAAGPLASLRLDVLHGRLPADTKDAVMRHFAAGDIDVLLTTTVVEVGIDVPGATVMVVLDADRFGVSQLHQLRGRVGRGDAPGLCLLVTEAPPGAPARARLEAVAATLDGFELARVDLAARREGDVLGALQSGRRSSLRLLSVLADEEVIVAARAEAGRLVAADPDLAGHPALAAAISDMVAPERADYLEKA